VFDKLLRGPDLRLRCSAYYSYAWWGREFKLHCSLPVERQRLTSLCAPCKGSSAQI
jgi:hypothetical protein